MGSVTVRKKNLKKGRVSLYATGIYYRLGITNYALGGSFNGRLNAILREEKGWTYNVASAFASTKDGGTFVVSTGVRAAVTDSAVAGITHILRVYADTGITLSELAFTKSAIEQSDVLNYETNSQKASYLSQIQQYGLDENFINEPHHILSMITQAKINGFAKRYLQPDQMVILVVGDQKLIAPGLLRLGYRLVELDTDGNIK